MKPMTRIHLAGVLIVVVAAFMVQQHALGQEAPDQNVAAQQAAQQSAQPASEDAGFMDILFSGGITGLIILIALLGLSITAVYLVVEHLMTLRSSVLIPEGLAEAVRQLLEAGKVRDAHETCRANPSVLSQILMHGMSELEGGWDAIEKSMEDATAEQSARLFRKIEYLSVIGNIAPMVGLLGTVTGMIFAFQTVASTQGAAGAGELAEGIYQALVTTVGGLVVAIPALGAFAVFRNRVDQLIAEVVTMTQSIMAPVKSTLRKQRRAQSGGKTA